MINTVSLTGRLTRDPDLKYTQSGIAVMSSNLAVDRKFTNAQGERETDFIQIVAWRKTAETMANHLNKGSLIGVEGHIQTRNYQHKDGYTVYVTEVVVDNFAFLESKNQASNGNQGYGQPNTQSNYQNSTQSNIGANNSGFNQSNNDPFDSGFEVDEDSLPF